LELARKGAGLVLAARRGQVLEDLVASCTEEGPTGKRNAVAVECDVACRADVQRVADTAVSAFGRIDVWINDAGVGAIGPFEQTPLEDHQRVIETNLIGTINGCHAAMRQFIRQALGGLPSPDVEPPSQDAWNAVAGIIINIASDLGKMPAPYYASYAASKHGVVGLSASLRQELHERKLGGIRVCTVMPEAHDTPFFQHASNYTGHETAALPPLHDPKKVIDTIVDLVENPKDEVNVGTMSPFTHALHKVIPGAIERITGHQVHKEQIEKSPVSPPTRGAVHGPDPEGTGVSGGERQKKEREKKQSKRK
jgi:short-subunit dehydrogenase